MNEEKERVILERIAHDKTPLRQRQLAEVVGLSLGMTNGILKKMTEKGLLLMEKVNSRNIKYIMTPKGWDELKERTEKYMKKTLRSIVYYREAIDHIVESIEKDGFKKINLIGKSDLDFILEWSCIRRNIELLRNQNLQVDCYTVYSERESTHEFSEHAYISLAEV